MTDNTFPLYDLDMARDLCGIADDDHEHDVFLAHAIKQLSSCIRYVCRGPVAYPHRAVALAPVRLAMMHEIRKIWHIRARDSEHDALADLANPEQPSTMEGRTLHMLHTTGGNLAPQDRVWW